MACRKAAYRAMTELSEYMEKQQEEAAKKQEALEKEQEQYWTPPAVLQNCCIQWLTYGHEVGSLPSSLLSSNRGCSGGCLKAHPRITLDFTNGQAVAKISHALDPFTNYLEEALQATSTSATPLNYRLTGLLSTHLEILKAKFGSHLVKVSPTALAQSQRAQERISEQEDLERQAKRRKLQAKAANSNLLESVLEICHDHSLQEHLDIADIAWMRLTCKTMAKIAARMATNRMNQIRLSYSVLLDGKVYGPADYGDIKTESYIVVPFESQKYNLVASHAPLSLVKDSAHQFVPTESTSTSFEWDSGPIGGDNEDHAGYAAPGHYRGHVIRVFLEGNDSVASTSCPERDVLFCAPLEVAQHWICGPRGMLEGVHDSSSLTYNVTSVHDQTNDDDGSVNYKGSFVLQSIGFTFNDLLGIYVRKKLPVAKTKYQASQQKRLSEKQYVKALAKAAREAPGRADAFERMIGW